MDLTTLEHFGKGAADHLAHAELPLGGSFFALKSVLCHTAHVRGTKALAKRQHQDVTEG
jgi:hypothetical protein